MNCKDWVYIISKNTFGTFVAYENGKAKVFIDGTEHKLNISDVVSHAESFKHRIL